MIKADFITGETELKGNLSVLMTEVTMATRGVANIIKKECGYDEKTLDLFPDQIHAAIYLPDDERTEHLKGMIFTVLKDLLGVGGKDDGNEDDNTEQPI